MALRRETPAVGQRFRGRALALAICCGAMPIGTSVGQVKPETARDFSCYIQSAEARMDARNAFLLADSDSALNEQLVRGRVQIVAPSGRTLATAQDGPIEPCVCTGQ